jgi:uncharacterized protein DUF1236
MKVRVHYGTMILALVSGIGSAAAQQGAAGPSASSAALELSEAQRTAIASAVRDARIPPPNHSFNMSIGAKVPPSIELHALPIAALSQAPEARNLMYTRVQNQVVLVDPASMHVVEVIRSRQ